jgi:hypothetical protein
MRSCIGVVIGLVVLGLAVVAPSGATAAQTACQLQPASAGVALIISRVPLSPQTIPSSVVLSPCTGVSFSHPGDLGPPPLQVYNYSDYEVFVSFDGDVFTLTVPFGLTVHLRPDDVSCISDPGRDATLRCTAPPGTLVAVELEGEPSTIGESSFDLSMPPLCILERRPKCI